LGREEVLAMGTIGEAARRAEIAHDGMLGHAERRLDGRADPEPLISSRASGDAGHAPGCARDHTLAAACELSPVEVENAIVLGIRSLTDDQQRAVLRHVRLLAAGGIDREALGREALAAWNTGAPLGSSWKDLELAGMSRLQEDWRRIGERLFAMGAASVAVPPDVARLRKAAAALSSSVCDCWVASMEELLAAAWAAGPVPTLPDADLARVIAAWPALDKWDRESIISDAEKWARMSWRYVARVRDQPDARRSDGPARLRGRAARGTGEDEATRRDREPGVRRRRP